MNATGPHIAFVTEGGPDVGLGHVSRCMALAGAAAARGAGASFVVPADPQVASLVRSVTAEVEVLARRLDPAGVLAALRRLSPDVVVVDSYAATPELLAALRSLATLVAVDDLADRRLPVDVVVNGSVAAEELPYDRTSGALFLLGARYALLDPGYATTPSRPARDRVERVLICLGGGRHGDAIGPALAAVDRVLDGGVVDVAAGPFDAGWGALDVPARDARNRVVVHRGRFGLRELMLEADVAISGAGVTLYELAATATPVVLVSMAGNQQPNFAAFERAGAVLAAGAAGDPGLDGAIESAFRRLAADRALRETMGARGRSLVDGRGATRVARAICRPVVSRR